MSKPWPVESHPIGLASTATVAWRFRGQVRVTAIVKASFVMAPSALMALGEPEPIVAEEIPLDPGAPLGSVRAPSDLAPYRLMADVILRGHAHVPAEGGTVRLTVFSEEKILVDRAVRVAGDAGGPVPLVWERALGGRRSRENPAGTGRAPGSRLPDLLDPDDPRRPIGVGAVPRSFPVRAALLGGLDARALSANLAEVPSEIDWAYFQDAPSAQRVDFLRGDEVIHLEGVHPDVPVFEARLPGVTAAGRIYGLAATPQPIAFRADALHIDADRLRCSVLFRASFAVPELAAGRAALDELILIAGVELPDQPIRWPESAQVAPQLIDEETTHEIAPAPRPRATVLLDWGEAGPPPPPRPRQPTVVMEAPPPRARMATVVMEAPPPRARMATVILEAAPAPPARQATTPLAWPEARAALPTVAISWGEAGPPVEPALDGTLVLTEDDSPLMGTMALSDEQQAAVAASVLAPFAVTAAGTSSASYGDIPGAPWAAALAAAAPSPTGEITRPLVLPARMALPDDLVLGEAPPRPAPPARREIPRPSIRAEIAARIDW